MRTRGGILDALRRDAAAWRGEVRRVGFRHGTLGRLRFHAGTEWLAGRVDELAARVAGLEAELGRVGSELVAAVGQLEAEQSRHVEERAGIDARLGALVEELGAVRTHLAEAQLHVAQQDRALRVATVMAWVAQATVAEDTLVSVVLPTRNRARYLPRAVESVVRQSYPNWELLIVDDASVDETAEVVAALDDPRIRTFTAPGRGASAARNVALSHAKGEVIAYIDDDNTMDRNWLKAVVWAFDQRPEIDVAYGALVIDDFQRLMSGQRGALPLLFLFDYDRAGLAHDNLTDMGAMAHRAGLVEGRFDETLREMADWDLLLRLTRDRDPLVLPAIACFYTTDAPNRLSNGPTHERDAARVRSKNRR